jgi:hypothetical protein
MPSTAGDDNSPPAPKDCEACAKVLRHALKYLDGTDCGFHPGVERLIREALMAERERCARVVETSAYGSDLSRKWTAELIRRGPVS